MASYVKFDDFVQQLCKGVHDLDGTHTIKVALSNTAPTPASDTGLGDLTEISAGNGYTAGGSETTPTLSEASGTAKLVCTDVVFTASGGTIGPFRYIVVYNDTASTPADALIAYWDYGSSITLQDGDTFTVDFDASNGIFQLS